MSTQARVTSLEALGRFRASLIVFANRSHSAVDQVTDELRRVRSWIQQEQRRRWEGEVQRRARVLAQAEQELLSAKMVKLLDNLNVQQAAVRKAKHALEEAETKLRNVKRWTRDFDSRTEALAKGLDSFRSVLVHDLPKGMAFLSEAQKTLESYGEMRAPEPGSGAPESGSAETEELPPHRMSTSGVENLLTQALKNLSAEWQGTREHWRDRKAAEFEKEYLEALPQHVSKAANIIKELNAVLRQIRNDCE